MKAVSILIVVLILVLVSVYILTNPGVIGSIISVLFLTYSPVQTQIVNNCTAQVNAYIASQLAILPHGTQMSIEETHIFYFNPGIPNNTGIPEWLLSPRGSSLDCTTTNYNPINSVCTIVRRVQLEIINRTLNLTSSDKSIIAIGVTVNSSNSTMRSYQLFCDYKGYLLPGLFLKRS